mgnify:CR=1 FL=1
MRAAIYARKSREEQAESIPTQIENAGTLIEIRGWSTRPEHLFTDTASRAEFVKRPGLARLRDLVEQGAIDVVVMRDGGERRARLLQP